MKKETASFTTQLSSFKTLKDGGYRITLDFGQDSIDAVHKLMKWNNTGEVNLACVLVPYNQQKSNSNEIETNEIEIG